MTARTQHDANRKLAGRLVIFAVGMFGFGFLLWPLYNVFCDIAGLNGRGSGLVEASVIETRIDSKRLVTVQFDANVNSELPWDFEPVEFAMKVHPGELSVASYIAKNTSAEVIVGQAVPSVAPGRAAPYFKKTECFCFTQQTLEAGEEREMPVHFIIDPDLPEDVRTVTLSYTFFRSETPEPSGS
ncbi:MAG: cytochrome c oxidase assembly protein [Gammaproteobacteria bacterium]|nr:MAG: cytochrome c oxidase assembly protein [Gammaproteobacteria bacterium]